MFYSNQRVGIRGVSAQVRQAVIRVRTALGLLLLASAALVGPAQGAPSPFYMGADISLETFMQQQGMAFSDNIGQAPLDTIMYDHGANLFRLRIFVNPETTYTNTNVGAIQTTAYDIALAQQIKSDAPNAKLVLDFHYSDTWADPGHQFLPAAWATPAQTLAQLETTVQNYTQSTLQAFKSAGVMPDIVQLGNETTGGAMWPTGKLNFNGTTAQKNASWAAYGGLWNAAIAGVRAVQDPGQRIPVSLSIDRGDKSGQPQFHYGLVQQSATVPDANGLTGGGVTDFDIEGVDFYPSTSNLIGTMQSNLTTLANTNYVNYLANPALPMKKIMLLENNYPWENSSVGSSAWPKTPAGQQAELQAVRDQIYNLPHDDGEGVLWWYPEAVKVPNYSIYNDGDTALFDSTSGSNVHNALPALSVFESTIVPGDVDMDGAIGMSDFDVIRANFGMSAGARRINGDLNGDGAVNLADFMLWKDLYTAAAGAGAASVPEPASLVLLVMSLPVFLGGIQLRRRGIRG